MTALRDRVPPRVARAIGGTLSRLPDSIGRLLRPRRYRGMPAELPSIDPLPDAPRRVLIGALNTAGQAHRWAEVLSRLPDTRAVSLSRVETHFAFAVDVAVPSAVGFASADWQRDHLRVRGLSATDVIIESGLPIFGPAVGWSLMREVRLLHKQGIRVAIVCHGSDVRDFDALNARNPHSPYALPEFAERLPSMSRRSAEARRVIRRTGVPVLGSTHGVLIDLPEATWVPVVIDPLVWAVETPPFAGDGPPVVVHAPSQSSIKGSDVVDSVLARLAAERAVHYVRLENVSHDDVREAYRRADIVIDSIRIGGYGVAACEAMAAGRLVISNVAESYRRDVRESRGTELPIVQADPSTLEAVLRDVLDHHDDARRLAANGPAYVAALHDGRESARVVIEALAQPAALGLRG